MGIDKPLISFLCSNCGKKLGEVSIRDGIVAIKCKCGTVNIIETKTNDSLKEKKIRT